MSRIIRECSELRSAETREEAERIRNDSFVIPNPAEFVVVLCRDCRQWHIWPIGETPYRTVGALMDECEVKREPAAIKWTE